MTAREFRILEYLAFRRGVVTSRQEIEAHIFDDKADTASNVVDSVICLLRQKMSAAGGGATIQTRRGLGYVLDADDT